MNEEMMLQIYNIVAEYVSRTHCDPTLLIKDALFIDCESVSATPMVMVSPNSTSVSRLVVNNDFRIILPDYDEMELKMTPIQRMFYIFFLLHPEGVLLKYLPDHRDELIRIYGQYGDRPATAVVNRYMVNDELRNQAISKINKSVREFVKIDDKKNPYLIAGERNRPYKIRLPQRDITVMPYNWLVSR